MKKGTVSALITSPVVVLIALGLAAAGSQGGGSIGGVPVFALSVALAFVIQWVAFIPAWLLKSERFFDLTGSIAYLSVTVLALVLGPGVRPRSVVLLALVAIWAVRLGSFLFGRIHAAGKDARFDELKTSFLRFLNVWTLQGMWVSFTLAAAVAAMTTTTQRPFGVLAAIGCAIWLFGFTIEVTADLQKRRFRAVAENRGRFINTGLWAWSRHPNYFGEIALWVGVALVALPVLRGWQLVTLISPLFVALLLTRVSGIPLLEKRSDERWGGQDGYEEYKKRTPVLIPLPPSIGRRRNP